MFGIDWNGNGMIDGFDQVIDLMILDEMEENEEDEDNAKEEYKMEMKTLTVDEMLYEIETYYDCEGRIELFEKWVENATEQEVKMHYDELFKVPDVELDV